MMGGLGIKNLGLIGWKPGFWILKQCLGVLFEWNDVVSDICLTDSPSGYFTETNLLATLYHSLTVSEVLTSTI